MPPASRGFLFLRLLRRHASTKPLPPLLPKQFPPKRSLPPKDPAPRTVSTPETQTPSFTLRHTADLSFPFDAASNVPGFMTRLIDRFPTPIRRVIRRILRIVPWIPPLIFLIIHIPYQVVWITGPSMSPLLNPNFSTDTPNTQDRVLVKRLNLHDDASTQRGMVVVFYTPHNPEKVAVKRIVGVAGDRITPLTGSPGDSETTPIVVPYNHVWVEGDVSDRSKSRDSNSYGPISRNLILGEVRTILNPWYAPRSLDWRSHPYPAQSRVEQDAVHQPNPDAVTLSEAFRDGRAQAVLDNIRQYPQRIDAKLHDEKGRMELQRVYEHGLMEVQQQNPETLELAKALVQELQAKMEAEEAVNERTLEAAAA